MLVFTPFLDHPVERQKPYDKAWRPSAVRARTSIVLYPFSVFARNVFPTLPHPARIPPDRLLGSMRALNPSVHLLGDAPVGPVRVFDDQPLGEPADATPSARRGDPWLLRRARL